MKKSPAQTNYTRAFFVVIGLIVECKLVFVNGEIF